jgi:nucleotide-binding universal stress UspA family protein
MYQKILIPLDGSKQAESALRLASKLARISNAEITLLRVVEYPYGMYSACDPNTFMNLNQPDEKLLAEKSTFCREAEDYLKGLASIVEMAVSKVFIEVKECPVVDSILSIVEESEIDLIVMSTVGQDRNPWLMGSVTNRILREAPVPVILIRKESHDSIPDGSHQQSTSTQNKDSIHPAPISTLEQIVLDT